MSKVHTFPLVSELFLDTRLPLQYPGGGNSPDASQLELALLLEFIAGQLALATEAVIVSTGDIISVRSGNLIQTIAVESQPGARTIKIGTFAGGDDVLELSDIESNKDFAVTVNRYTSSTFQLHFTLTGGTASVLVFTRAKA